MVDRSGRAGKVLIVDDTRSNVDLFQGLLSNEGYEVSVARDGEEALAAVRREHPDLVLLDVMLPKADGFDVCRALKGDESTRLTPVVLVTAHQEPEKKIQGITAGADDFLTKPVNVHELRARVRSLIRLKHYTDDLDSAESVIVSLALTIEARDAYTDGHCQRLASYATSLGAALGLPDEDLSALYRGGFLHDVGKVGVPDRVLLKPGPLTPAEFALIKQHPVIGDRLCGEMRSLRPVRPIIRHHHERLDGTGYPDGLRGDDIPLLAQIMSVVDVYDALTTERPYKPTLTPEQAWAELEREVEKGWRARRLVETLIDLGRADRLVPVAGVGAARLSVGTAARPRRPEWGGGPLYGSAEGRGAA